MKKYIIIFSALIVTLSLAASSIINWNDSNTTSKDKEVVFNNSEDKSDDIFSDFVYGIGPRFDGIKKSDFDKATSIDAFLENDQLSAINKLHSVNIVVIENDRPTNISAYGDSKVFNKQQLDLLDTFDYSTNFMVKTEYEKVNGESGQTEFTHSTPHLTIVPEKQAVYDQGYKALKLFLKENSKDTWNTIDPNKLQPAKLYFTVTKSGTIENIRLDRSSNFEMVDKRMIEILDKAPGNWSPAENSKGEKVDQELVVSFGLMGC